MTTTPSKKNLKAKAIIFDGGITTDRYDKLLESKKKRQLEILDTMERHRRGDRNYYVTAERLLHLASHAADYYKSSKPQEKRQLLHFLLSNCELNGKKLKFSLKQPFNTILLHASRSNWLGGRDSNPDCSVQSADAYH